MTNMAAQRGSAGTEQLLSTLFHQSIAAYFHFTLITNGYFVSNVLLMNWTCAGLVSYVIAAAAWVTTRYILC